MWQVPSVRSLHLSVHTPSNKAAEWCELRRRTALVRTEEEKYSWILTVSTRTHYTIDTQHDKTFACSFSCYEIFKILIVHPVNACFSTLRQRRTHSTHKHTQRLCVIRNFLSLTNSHTGSVDKWKGKCKSLHAFLVVFSGLGILAFATITF